MKMFCPNCLKDTECDLVSAVLDCHECGEEYEVYNAASEIESLEARVEKAEDDLSAAKALLEDAHDELYNSGMSPALLARIDEFLWTTGCAETSDE